MAIEKFKLKSGEVRYRAIWINPLTKKKESRSFSDKLEALDFDLQMKKRIKGNPESFNEQTDFVTYADIAWEYLKAKPLSEQYRYTNVWTLKNIILPVLGDKNPLEITRRDMSKITAICRQRNHKQNTIHSTISIAKRILNWGVNEGIIEINPVRDYKVPHGGDLEILPPTTAERDAIWSHARDHLKRAIVLSTGIGVRVGRSELFDIQWSDVNFAEGTLTIRSARKNKEKQFRVIELNPSLISILEGWHQADKKKGVSYIIHWGKKKIRSIQSAWDSAKKKAGITRRLRPYDMRHYFVTEAIKAGADLKAVAEIVGHSSLAMILKHYQHVVSEQKRFAIDSIPVPKAIPNGNNNGNNGG